MCIPGAPPPRPAGNGCPSNYNASAVATFLRLLTFLRPYRRGVWLSGVLAALAMGATVAIPALTGAAVNAIDANDGQRLKVLAALIAVAGVVRLGLTVLRCLFAVEVFLRVEYDV